MFFIGTPSYLAGRYRTPRARTSVITLQHLENIFTMSCSMAALPALYSYPLDHIRYSTRIRPKTVNGGVKLVHLDVMAHAVLRVVPVVQ